MKTGGVYLGFHTLRGRKFPHGNFRTTRVLRSRNADCRKNAVFRQSRKKRETERDERHVAQKGTASPYLRRILPHQAQSRRVYPLVHLLDHHRPRGRRSRRGLPSRARLGDRNAHRTRVDAVFSAARRSVHRVLVQPDGYAARARHEFHPHLGAQGQIRCGCGSRRAFLSPRC